MYRQYDQEFNFPALEKEILKFWEDNRIFAGQLALRKNAPRFVFYEGPPTANGLPHVGHALSRTIKDSICRYQSMKGFLVERKAGWDTHGLPVELNVEKELGLESKEQIEEYGIAEFNRRCRESVFTYKKEWDEFTRKLGYWLDLENAYITYENYYIETVWWILKKFHDAGLLYRGHKIVPWCPRCGTALSSHEVAQGYDEVTDPSIFVKMKLKTADNTYFLVWTTTPWTLISNAAVALSANEPYVTIVHEGQRLILAKQRLGVIDGEYRIVEEKPGREYEGVEYEPLFSFLKVEAAKAHFATTAEFVTMDDGTGIVHIAPAFGEDDYELGKKCGLPVLQAVDTRGNFIDSVADWKGRFVKEADPLITENLKQRGLLYKAEQYTHTYPFCWRCDTPLLYYARSSWYIRTTAFKDRLIEANRQITWYPEEIGRGRFGEWLENNIDWALSRERYWGTPLPIWICQACGKEKVIGGIEELKQCSSGLPDKIDLHRPFVDSIVFACSDCGGKMNRVSEVIDVWFDSGAMPYAQVHYPFENADRFEPDLFPAEFIAEAIDQTRGWFYSMLAISVFISGKPSYKRCVVNDLVLDAEGKKMSKRLGNVIDPSKSMETYGADILRWHLISSSQLWLPKRFSESGLVETLRKFFSTLQNSYSFFALYADIDRFDPAAGGEKEFSVLDRWLVSRLNGLIKSVGESYDAYDFNRAARAISNFVIEELSNWWIKRSRKRFWGAAMSPDKRAAYYVLFESLLAVAKLMAPISPFFAEDIFRRLTESLKGYQQSVHHCDFPRPDESLIDKNLDYAMSQIQNIVSLGRAARKEAGIKVRQPLRKLVVIDSTGKPPAGFTELSGIILDELNIKNIEFTSDEEKFIKTTAEPVFKEIGPKFGASAQKVAAAVKNLSAAQIAELKENGAVSIDLEGRRIMLTSAEIAIKVSPSAGYCMAADSKIKVAIDLELDEQLRAEGFARELVNKIQNMRKNAGFEVTDRVKVGVSRSPQTELALARYAEYIKNETLAVEIGHAIEKGINQKWDVNGVETVIAIEKI